MYSISRLVHSTFFHDKAARKKYVEISGLKRATPALNRLSVMIQSGEIDQSITCALLSVGVTVASISTALHETQEQKWDEAHDTHRPKLLASFKLVPSEKRTVGISYLVIGHFTDTPLQEDIARLPWHEQLSKVREQIAAHRNVFFSDSNSTARQNYFGGLSGYTYVPALNLEIQLTSQGELVQKRGMN